MARYSADQVLEIILGILVQGRGGGGVDLSQPPFTTIAEVFNEGSRPPRRSQGRRSRTSTRKGMVRATARRAYEPKRKVSAYQREFGRQLKKLKKKHPRTPVTRLMKRAHAATKRARRGK